MKKFLIVLLLCMLFIPTTLVYAQFIGHPNPVEIEVYRGEVATGTVTLLLGDIEVEGEHLGLPDWLSWNDHTLTLTARPTEETRLGLHQYFVTLHTQDYGNDLAIFHINVRDAHVPVTSITNVPSTMQAGGSLSLTGTVNPETATNTSITWSISSAGGTSATISGSTLNAYNAGIVTVTATINNGQTPTTNFTQNFQITVTQANEYVEEPAEETHTPPAITEPPPWAVTGGVQTQQPPAPIHTPPQISFIDVFEGQWYYEYVINVSDFFHGRNEAAFNPSVSMTRAMFVVSLAGLDRVNTHGLIPEAFSDVSRYSWYGPSVAWASNAGIVNGIGYGLFAPNSNITREQIAVMFLNYARHRGVNLQNSGANFTDSLEISSWALEAVGALSTVGVIAGRPDGSFDPASFVTRAETAAIFSRFADLMLILQTVPAGAQSPGDNVIVPREPVLPPSLN